MEIVLVHGIRLSGTVWGPLIDRLGPDHRVVAPDLPGHGTRRGEEFTMDGAVAAIADAVDTLGGRALVAGHSLGGFAAMATAARHPGRVAGLVAIGSSAIPRGPFLTAFRTAARVLALRPSLGNRLSALALRRLLPPPLATAALAGGLSCEVMPAAVAAVARFDPVAAVTAYPGPIHLVNGDRDRLGADAAAFGPRCRLITLPGRGHIDCLADLDTLADVLLDSQAATRPQA